MTMRSHYDVYEMYFGIYSSLCYSNTTGFLPTLASLSFSFSSLSYCSCSHSLALTALVVYLLYYSLVVSRLLVTRQCDSSSNHLAP
jgi:hypothetical protein